MNRKKEQEKIRSVVGENSWGNQIRTYTLHPYHVFINL